MTRWDELANQQQQHMVIKKPACEYCGDIRYNRRLRCQKTNCRIVGCDFCMVADGIIGGPFCPPHYKESDIMIFVFSLIFTVGFFIAAWLIY